MSIVVMGLNPSGCGGGGGGGGACHRLLSSRCRLLNSASLSAAPDVWVWGGVSGTVCFGGILLVAWLSIGAWRRGGVVDVLATVVV
ncbi:hypothetical protein BDZ91DRAFT_743942, partial [Kalaharituber pfeilii]